MEKQGSQNDQLNAEQPGGGAGQPPPYSPVAPAPAPGYAPQQGYAPPPQGYAPQQGYGPPPQGYAPKQGTYPPPQGYAPQPGFAPQPGVQPQVVFINNNVAAPSVNVNTAPQVVTIAAVPKPKSYMGLSCCVFFCCNPLAGLIGFILALLSDSAANDGAIQRARTLGQAALAVNILGVIVTVIIVIVIVSS